MANSLNLRRLQPEKVVETIDLLERRIGERFPGSGLRNVAATLFQIGQETVERSAKIQKPNIPLRVAVILLVAGALASLAMVFPRLRGSDELLNLDNFIQALDASLEASVFLGAAAIFLFSLELRLKRKRALAAIHELRALAHIVDMHQLTKDPERVTGRGSTTSSSPKRTMTPFELGRYLDYCSELLSLISKVGTLYVQDFPDTVALESVDQLANLTNGLARNIWQKIMILENMLGPATGGGEPATAETGSEPAKR